MQAITFSNLRTRTSELKDALKRGEDVELTVHGRVIAVIKPVREADDKTRQAERDKALEAFFELGEDITLETELDRIRAGRKGRGGAV